MKINDAAGKAVTLDDTVFAKEYNEALIHQAVVAYMAAGRSGTKAQKTRSEVSGGGIKPWRQKGTGRARSGTTRSPIWRKGGITFAASPRCFDQKMNKKMYRAALRSILSELVRTERLVVVDDFGVTEPKTKSMLVALDKLGSRNALLVSDELDNNVVLSARNIPHCETVSVAGLNPLSLIAHEKVVMTASAIGKVQEWLS